MIYIYIGRWEIVSALFVLVFREGETKKKSESSTRIGK